MSNTDNNKIQNLRQEYHNQRTLNPNKDPFNEFNLWFKEALIKEIEPNAMTLATVDENGVPYTRIVLLKGLQNKKFIFYTNYESRKAKHIENNNNVSLTFWWQTLSRAVHIQGKAKKNSQHESITYFQSRPKANKIGAIVSKQSQIIDNLDDLIEKANLLNKKYENNNAGIPKPEAWGGYEVEPFKIEFWKGMPSRLHERILYSIKDIDVWTITRLAP